MARLKMLAGDTRGDVISTATAASGYPLANAFRIGRGASYRTANDLQEVEARFQGVERSADTLFWARANVLRRKSLGDSEISISSRAILSPIFDGSNDRLGTSYAVNPSTGLSVAVVCRLMAFVPHSLVAAWSGGANSRLLFQPNSNGRVQAFIYNGASNFIGSRTNDSFYELNRNYVFVFTYDGGTSPAGTALYGDGVSIKIADSSGGSFSTPGAGDVLFIGSNNPGSSPSNAYIPEVCYFNVELTGAQVLQVSSQLMNKHGIAGAPLGADYYKDFNDYSNLRVWLKEESFTITSGAISQWDDSSGSGNDATQATADHRPLRSRRDALSPNPSHCAVTETIQIDETTLAGQENDDIATALDLPPSRYWAIRSATDTAFKHEWCLVAFGQALDLGRYPEPRFQKVLDTGVARYQTERYSMSFAGVSHALAREFQDFVERNKYAPVIIYDEDATFIKGKSGTFAVENYSITPSNKDSNRITVDLRAAR